MDSGTAKRSGGSGKSGRSRRSARKPKLGKGMEPAYMKVDFGFAVLVCFVTDSGITPRMYRDRDEADAAVLSYAMGGPVPDSTFEPNKEQLNLIRKLERSMKREEGTGFWSAGGGAGKPPG